MRQGLFSVFLNEEAWRGWGTYPRAQVADPGFALKQSWVKIFMHLLHKKSMACLRSQLSPFLDKLETRESTFPGLAWNTCFLNRQKSTECKYVFAAGLWLLGHLFCELRRVNQPLECTSPAFWDFWQSFPETDYNDLVFAEVHSLFLRSTYHLW